MMGNGIEAEFEEMVKALPKGEDGVDVDLTQFTKHAKECACQLVELAEANKKERANKDVM